VTVLVGLAVVFVGVLACVGVVVLVVVGDVEEVFFAAAELVFLEPLLVPALTTLPPEPPLVT
jgi:hypothetical protein